MAAPSRIQIRHNETTNTVAMSLHFREANAADALAAAAPPRVADTAVLSRSGTNHTLTLDVTPPGYAINDYCSYLKQIGCQGSTLDHVAHALRENYSHVLRQHPPEHRAAIAANYTDAPISGVAHSPRTADIARRV